MPSEQRIRFEATRLGPYDLCYRPGWVSQTYFLDGGLLLSLTDSCIYLALERTTLNKYIHKKSTINMNGTVLDALCTAVHD